MITIQSRIRVEGVSGKEIYNFLINADDRDYQRWWAGTHLQLHTLRRRPNNIGNIIYMDEFIGKHRVKMKGIVIGAEPGKKITLQMKKFIPLPVWLFLKFDDDPQGVTITHTVKAGFRRIGKIFDFLFRLHFSGEFEKALDEHVKTEFPKLRDMLLLAKTEAVKELTVNPLR